MKYHLSLRGDAQNISSPQQLRPLRLVHGAHQAKYICSCGGHEAITCTCSSCHKILRNDNSPCKYFGRCVEPLAWNIEDEFIHNQTQSPLFSTFPKEIRDMIFEYALTDGISQSLEGFFSRHTDRFGSKFEDMCRNNIAVNLLRTCRAVYLETWALPLSLNSYILFDINTQSKSNIELHELFPWQLGLIQSLDITLQQCSLEGKGSRLYQYLHRGSTWQVEARHKGAYVAPRRYKSNKKPRAMVEFPASFNFTLVPAETNQPRPVLSQILGLYPRQVTLTRSPPPWSSKMRVTLAKPLAHLTLRLEHHDWWTWGDHPDSTNPLQQLGLDPTMGDGYADESLRPTKLRMIGLADERRAGQHPHAFPDQGWAATIADLPDLKSLRLVLETFALKAKQLDVVVEAAKTWRFPIARSDCELVWDGEVEAKRSVDMKSLDGRERVAEDINPEDPWDWGTHEFEVRVVRFVRRRVL